MTEITWATVVGVLLLVSQILNLINSTAAAKKNANAPLDTIRKDVAKNREDIGELKHTLTGALKDIDHAHDKIRKNENAFIETTKAQNKALLAILLWIKDPEHGDAKQIDEAIKGISV